MTSKICVAKNRYCIFAGKSLALVRIILHINVLSYLNVKKKKDKTDP